MPDRIFEYTKETLPYKALVRSYLKQFLHQITGLQKRNTQNGKGAKKGLEDNEESEEHIFPRVYKLVLFRPMD